MKNETICCDNSQVKFILNQLAGLSLKDLATINAVSAEQIQRRICQLQSCKNEMHDYFTPSVKDKTDDVDKFLDLIRHTATDLEEKAADLMVKQAARGGILPADYNAKIVLDIVSHIEKNNHSILSNFLACGKKPVQLVCAFYAGLQRCNALGNITKSLIAEHLKHDDTFFKYKLDYLKKNLSPDPAEDWYKDITLVIEEATRVVR